MVKLNIIFYISKIGDLYMNSIFFVGFTKFHFGSNVRYILTFIFLISQINEIKKNILKFSTPTSFNFFIQIYKMENKLLSLIIIL